MIVKTDPPYKSLQRPPSAGVLHRRITVPLVLMTLCLVVRSSDLERQDRLVWDFAEFVQSFSMKDWPGISKFIDPETKAGFGGEMGMEGLLQVFGADEECHKAMVRVLEMGCRKTGAGEGMRCISPPHLGPDVIYLGARASFKYDIQNETWVAEFLICGGD